MLCVCVCVLGSMCLKIVVERWFWELKMLIGSLVKLHAWLHLYLCFSLHKKLFLSNLNNFLTLGYLPNFSTSFYRNLDSFLTARWINRQTFWTLDSWWINRASLLSFLLNCSSTDPWQLHPSKPFKLNTCLDTSICQDLLNSYIYL